jgi:hypothetical protein
MWSMFLFRELPVLSVCCFSPLLYSVHMPVTWLPEGVDGGLYDIWKKDRRLVHQGSFAIVKFRMPWQAAAAKEAF